MLLETASSRSPFHILPPPPSAPERAVPDAVPASAGRPAPAMVPPPAVHSAPLGSRGRFFAILVTMVSAFLIWPWSRVVMEDLVAGTAFLAMAPALLTVGARREAWRKTLSPLLWLAAMVCFTLFVRGGGGFVWAGIEILIAAGLGAACTAGGAYLGPWGSDSDEVLWARVLTPIGAVLLVIAAVTWATPENASWSEALVGEGKRAWLVWSGTGGLWRWAGVLVLAGSAGGVRSPGEEDRGPQAQLEPLGTR